MRALKMVRAGRITAFGVAPQGCDAWQDSGVGASTASGNSLKKFVANMRIDANRLFRRRTAAGGPI